MSESRRDWKRFVLLLIDLQEDFWSKETARSFPQFAGNIGSLLSLCREEGIEIIHLRGKGNPDKTDWMPIYKLGRNPCCIQGTPGIETLQFALEKPGETVIHKKTYDGFHTPDLMQCLRKKGKRFVLTAGLVTSVCVLFTTVSAAQKGMLCAVVEDCCADKPEAHKRTLDHYGFIFDRITVGSILERHPKWLDDLRRLDS